MAAWFEAGERAPDDQPPRIDYYVCHADGDGLGIKLREGRIEVKQRQREYGLFRFHPRVTGRVEAWRKWGFALKEADRDLASILVPTSPWIAVTKERKLRPYRVSGDRGVVAAPTGEPSAEGCGLELARLRIQGREWWSLAFEAFGAESDLQASLTLTARHIFTATDPPDLDGTDSYGYPRWLKMAAHEWRQGATNSHKAPHLHTFN
jgi:hypothetical protein